jgi:hypothetical protein
LLRISEKPWAEESHEASMSRWRPSHWKSAVPLDQRAGAGVLDDRLRREQGAVDVPRALPRAAK